MGKSLYNMLFIFVLGFGLSGIAAAEQIDYPIPISEYVEKSAPFTTTFLSYPKYYRNVENELTLVDTTLHKSTDPDWDYEVVTGIWTLRVRTDGTYQAEHEGDVFTYRLADLGLGRGDSFHSLNLGKPDFSRFSVLGDRIRWADVFPDVDFEVRYINDIMKVDVIVKKNRLDAIKAVAWNEYLTAKFDIPAVIIRSQAKQGGFMRNLYWNAFHVDEPLVFEKEGKTVHQLRPTLAYTDPDGLMLKGSQTWRLISDRPGEVELSVSLSDTDVLSEGDLVIDPSSTFDGTGHTSDTYLNQGLPYTNYGDGNYMYLGYQSYNTEERMLIGFGILEKFAIFTSPNIIDSAVLKVYMSSSPGGGNTISARAYKVNNYWYETGVTWDTGIGYDSSTYSDEVTIGDSNGYYDFDVTNIVRSYSYPSNVLDYGFMIKRTGGTSNYYDWRFNSSENPSNKPQLIVTHPRIHKMNFYTAMGYTNDYADELIDYGNQAIQNDDGPGEDGLSDNPAYAVMARNNNITVPNDQRNLYEIMNSDDKDQI
ncbi:MAG: DNRLRE domain-containing protein [bacterium]|nr:DNRLRE domain-containing protein [bacterium]